MQVVSLGPPKASALRDGTAIETEHRPMGWADGGRLGDLLRRFDSEGPPPWRPQAVTRLVELTGLGRGPAALLLAGAPGLRSYEVNFLSKQAREAMGLSVAEARTGRDALAGLPAKTIVAVLDAAMPADPADLWRTGPDVGHWPRRGSTTVDRRWPSTPSWSRRRPGCWPPPVGATCGPSSTPSSRRPPVTC
jgi:hypothetical protein